jgi:hypothetical protein
MPTKHYPARPKYKEINFSQAGAVQNTWYTAVDGVNIELLGFGVGCTVADETLEIRATVDGVSIASAAAVACTFAANPYSTMPATCVYTTGTAVFTQSAAAASVPSLSNAMAWLKGVNVKIEVRKTTAGGASAVTGKGAYLQW